MDKFRVIELPQELDITAPHLLKIFVAKSIAIQQWKTEGNSSLLVLGRSVHGSSTGIKWGWFTLDDSTNSPISHLTRTSFSGIELYCYTMYPYMGKDAAWIDIPDRLDFDKYAK